MDTKARKMIRLITRVAIFGAIAIILYTVPLFNPNLPIFPSFLQLHFDEVPVFIASFAYGPLTGSLIIVVKTLIKLPMTHTLCVGELADALYSFAFVIPAVIFYYRKKTFLRAIVGLSLGVICQLIITSIFNVFVMLPFYSSVMGLESSQILSMCHTINPLINNLYFDYILWVNIPFNLIKDGIVFVLVLVLYKMMKKLIEVIEVNANISDVNGKNNQEEQTKTRINKTSE